MRIISIFLFEHDAGFSDVIDVFYYQRKYFPINKCRKYDGTIKPPCSNATVIAVVGPSMDA